jgi:hypothetical protein
VPQLAGAGKAFVALHFMLRFLGTVQMIDSGSPSGDVGEKHRCVGWWHGGCSSDFTNHLTQQKTARICFFESIFCVRHFVSGELQFFTIETAASTIRLSWWTKPTKRIYWSHI